MNGGDLLLSDAGQKMPFRAGIFDAAISISAIQVTRRDITIICRDCQYKSMRNIEPIQEMYIPSNAIDFVILSSVYIAVSVAL